MNCRTHSPSTSTRGGASHPSWTRLNATKSTMMPKRLEVMVRASLRVCVGKPMVSMCVSRNMIETFGRNISITLFNPIGVGPWDVIADGRQVNSLQMSPVPSFQLASSAIPPPHGRASYSCPAWTTPCAWHPSNGEVMMVHGRGDACRRPNPRFSLG